MRKQIFWPIGIKTKAQWSPHSTIFGITQEPELSYKCKKFYQGIPLPNNILQSSSQIPEKASWDIQVESIW